MVWFVAGIILALFVSAIFRNIQPSKDQIIIQYKSSAEFKNYLESVISERIANERTQALIKETDQIIKKVSESNNKTTFDFTEVQFYDDSTSSFSQEEIIKFKENKIPSEWLKPVKNPLITNRFTGKKIVITGDFSFSRIDLAKLLWESGADLDTAINSKTDYAIKGDNAGWRKCEQIEELGVTCISEDEILKDFPDL